MKRTYFITAFLLILAMSLFSCSSLSGMETPQDPIIGKWGLVRTVSGRTPQGNIVNTYSIDEFMILEFKPGNILTVQCLRQDNNCGGWRTGNYSYYFYLDGRNQTMINIIGNIHWWFRVSETELVLDGSPVGRGRFFFERIVNINE